MPRDPFEIREVDSSQDRVLRNLLEPYCHDMAEWFQIDAKEDGRYSYGTEKLWKADSNVYLAYAEKIPVGFALVGSGEEYVEDPNARDLVEFFVVRRHRGSGLGRALATYVWNARRGPWVVRAFQGNTPALPFWRRAIEVYTTGDFREEKRHHENRDWSYFIFNNTG